MSSLQAKLQHKYALSEKGAKDMMKAFVSVTISNLVLMFPVWMLYFLVRDYYRAPWQAEVCSTLWAAYSVFF